MYNFFILFFKIKNISKKIYCLKNREKFPLMEKGEGGGVELHPKVKFCEKSEKRIKLGG